MKIGAVVVLDHSFGDFTSTTIERCGASSARNMLTIPNTWQLAGYIFRFVFIFIYFFKKKSRINLYNLYYNAKTSGFVIIDSELSFTKSTLVELHGWQTGVLWCEDSKVQVKSKAKTKNNQK